MQFVHVGSVEEALDKLNTYGRDAAILAGGTDLMIQLDRGQLDAEVFIHIETLADLSYVRANRTTEIGALTTHRKLAESAELGDHSGAIRTGAALCGGWQTQ